jgi:hypothetical protein
VGQVGGLLVDSVSTVKRDDWIGDDRTPRRTKKQRAYRDHSACPPASATGWARRRSSYRARRTPAESGPVRSAPGCVLGLHSWRPWQSARPTPRLRSLNPSASSRHAAACAVPQVMAPTGTLVPCLERAYGTPRTSPGGMFCDAVRGRPLLEGRTELLPGCCSAGGRVRGCRRGVFLVGSGVLPGVFTTRRRRAPVWPQWGGSQRLLTAHAVDVVGEAANADNLPMVLPTPGSCGDPRRGIARWLVPVCPLALRFAWAPEGSGQARPSLWSRRRHRRCAGCG